jgi:hypothetical protein
MDRRNFLCASVLAGTTVLLDPLSGPVRAAARSADERLRTLLDAFSMRT